LINIFFLYDPFIVHRKSRAQEQQLIVQEQLFTLVRLLADNLKAATTRRDKRPDGVASLALAAFVVVAFAMAAFSLLGAWCLWWWCLRWQHLWWCQWQ
jgi:hypothetical protein